MTLPSNLITVEKAAKALGVTTGRIRQMLRAEILEGQKINERAWIVDPDSLKKAEKIEQTVGRPRNGKK